MKRLALSKKQIILIAWAVVLTAFCVYILSYLIWGINSNLETLETLKTWQEDVSSYEKNLIKSITNCILIAIFSFITYASFITVAVFGFLSERKRLDAKQHD